MKTSLLVLDFGSYTIKACAPQKQPIECLSRFPLSDPNAAPNTPLEPDQEPGFVILDGKLQDPQRAMTLMAHAYHHFFVESSEEVTLSEEAIVRKIAEKKNKRGQKYVASNVKDSNYITRDLFELSNFVKLPKQTKAIFGELINTPLRNLKRIFLKTKSQQTAKAPLPTPSDVLEDEEEEEKLMVVFLTAPFIPIEHFFQLSVLAFQYLQATHVQFQIPAFYTSLYVSQSTALVLDIGHGLTCAIPVCEGVVISPAIHKSRLAGLLIDTLLASKGNEKLKEELVVLKDPLSWVMESTDLSEDEITDIIYTECLFDPGVLQNFEIPEEYLCKMMEELPIDQLVETTIGKSPMSCRKALWENIYITGGTSKLNGLNERLTTCLRIKAPQGISPDIRMIDDPKFAAINGAIFCIENGFNDHWLTIGEFIDNPDLLVEKFSLLEYSQLANRE